MDNLIGRADEKRKSTAAISTSHRRLSLEFPLIRLKPYLYLQVDSSQCLKKSDELSFSVRLVSGIVCP
jgi:hypothetical protein